MSNQIVITSGAKVRELNDVIIGTSGVLSSLAFNVANGVPKLDSNAKILVSQLPNSVMEYQGTWNAATNTPTLTNGGAFNQGDVYLCNVAGTTNFGAGPISFIVGDSAIYSGSIWQRSGGATGSVTSVGLSTDGNAITIGSSPITTSGTITANFAGTSGQYINGAGNLTTFPTLLSSVGLSMPSAFSVSNSPLTANGTIAVTGAGYPSQYIRGDGTLADFPTSGGGGSSVSYYLNGGTSQGTIGGVTYYEMSKTADTGTGVDFNKTGDGLIVSFLTDAGDPAQLNIPAGNWNYEIYASMSSNGGTPQMYAELYVYNGTTFTLISTSSNEILYDGVNLNLYTFAMTVPATTLAITDRLAIKLYATNSGGKITTVHTQDSHLCQIITTFSTGITALNGLTAQVQYFATGTSGTDFNISSTTATHTFNIPDASASARGLITTGTQTIAGLKTITGVSLILSPVSGDAGILNIKRGAFAGGINDYTSITSQADDLTLVSLTSSTNRSIKFDFSSITSGFLRTYTLPNASGTLALTSNLSSYVPYTGATANVNLGAYAFQAGGVITTGRTTSDIGGSFVMKIGNGSNNVGDASSVTMYAPTASQLMFVYKDASSIIKLVSLSPSQPDSSQRYFSWPSSDGTLALTSDLGSYVTLATNQTISGNKIFSANPSINTGGQSSLSIASSTGNSALIFGYVNNILKGTIDISATEFKLISAIDNILKFQSNANFRASLIFSNSADYSYTFPAATGTLALTSNLSSYVPYTGATADVDLGNNSLYLNNSKYIFGRNVGNTTAYNILGINSSNKVQIDASGLGTIFGGAATIFGLLTGTTAAFSDSGTATNTNLISLLQPNLTASSGPILTLGKAIAINNAASIQFYYTSSGSSSNSLLLALYGSTGLTIYGNGNGSIAGSFTIGSTLSNGTYTYTLPSATGTLPVGTGTSGYVTYFSGTNTITGSSNHYWDNTNSRLGINTNTPLSPLQVVIGAGSGTVARFGEASGTTGKQLLVGVDTATGRSELQSVWQGTSATPLALNPSSGSVLIGTTTDSGYRLDVNGTFRAAGAATFSSSVGVGGAVDTYQQATITASTNYTVLGLYNTTSNSSNRNWTIATNDQVFGDFAIRQSSAANGNPFSVGNIRMYINPSGNVGIGTTTPDNLLVVSGGTGSMRLEATSTNRSAFVVQNTGNALYMGIDNSSGTYFGSSAYAINFQGSGNYPMLFWTNSLERMRITADGGTLITAGNSYANYALKILNAAGTEKLRVDGNGNLLVGYTTDQGYKFGVNGTSIQSGNAIFQSNVVFGSAFTAANSFNFYQNYSAGQLGFDFYNSSSQVIFTFNGNTQTITLKGLSGTGNRAVYSDANGTLTNTSSDGTLKRNVTTIVYGLNSVLNLKPISFNWIDTEKMGSQTEIGFIAQEVQEVIPEVIGTNNNETLSLDYPKLTAVLVKAIQEQQEMITSLQDRLDKLENK